MLTFFRRIRQSLLNQGAVPKYLLYAIGEIALVVIGILIALQINNWSEWKKDRIKETSILTELMRGLERNSILLEESLKRNEGRDKSTQIILQFFEEKLPYSDTLDNYFFTALLRGQPGIYATPNSYEAFKNAGFDKVLDENLTRSIIRLFEEVYRGVEEWRTYGNQYAVNDHPYWMKHFIDNGYSLKPKDHNALLQSTEMYSLIQAVRRFRRIYSDMQKEALRENNEVLQLIKDQLQSDK